MTIEERDTARAIQTIARKLREPAQIDWEQRRYEIAKDCLCGILSNSDMFTIYSDGCISSKSSNSQTHFSAELATKLSLQCANDLIAKLKIANNNAE